MSFVALAWFTNTRSGQISLAFLNYRQFTREGALFVEVMLTNGTDNAIQYFPLYDVEQTELLPIVRTNNSLF